MILFIFLDCSLSPPFLPLSLDSSPLLERPQPCRVSSLVLHRREPLAIGVYLSQHQHLPALSTYPELFACLEASIQHHLSFLINLTV